MIVIRIIGIPFRFVMFVLARMVDGIMDPGGKDRVPWSWVITGKGL